MTPDTYYLQTARRMWQQFEPIHALVYYAPEVFEELAALGYDVATRWPTYFPLRAAPLGAPGPERVSSAFYSFSPQMVTEHVTPAWTIATSEQVRAARLRGVDRLFRRLMGDQIGTAGFAEAARLVRRVAEAADTAGRPLAAGNADLPWPDEPHLVLWQAVTIIREQRGDGHVAALLTNGLDPCEALVSFAAIGAAPVETFDSRQWTSEQWEAAADRLRSRGWIDADGKATDLGLEGRDQVERLTDRLAAGAWTALSETEIDRLVDVNNPILTAALLSGLLPGTNTLGIATVQPPKW
ncbi:SCO6745 family protein [Actinoallomurus sp. CA-150999]|uniref:SCO6745 family protein n=1 Tax=Actinoallomurus sp. CA-150999 TaxID=3239887 RepID=UPI003D8CC8AB